jgi:tRNA threonylcarbamoyladenosine biosynthesis protein TsaE
MMKLQSDSPDQTMRIAKEFSKKVKGGDVICLRGDLGAGKTQFVRGFVQGFGFTGNEVSSPTFTVINEYRGEPSIYHFDCYRLEHYSEAVEIGAEEYFYGDGITIIEWPDKIAEILPNDSVNITIKVLSENKRELLFH